MNKKHIPFIVLIVFFVFACAFLFIFNSVRYPAQSKISINGESVIALNKNAVKGISSGRNNYMYFEFTQNQKVRFQNQVARNTGHGLKVSLLSDSGDFFMGFIYKDDFLKKGKLKHSLDARPLVTGSFSQEHRSFSVMLSSFLTDDCPEGFFLYSQKKMQVLNVDFSVPEIGFDCSENIPCFCFGPQGGTVDWNFSSYDFTEAGKYFPQKNSLQSLMPVINLEFEKTENIGTWQENVGANIQWGSELLFVRKNPLTDEILIQAASLKNPYARVNADVPLKKIVMTLNAQELSALNDGTVLSAVPTDLGFILDWPRENWRCADYELFKWNMFPEVLFFDFADYKVQNEFFTRLAYFVEKKGYKGTLVSDDFVNNRHGYNAHDYKAQDLADFFTKAGNENFRLNEREKLLCRILQENKIIHKNKDGTYTAGTGCVISISRESPDYLRNTFLAHESWHGIFFIDENFRNIVASLYYMFDEDSLEFIRVFWETQNGLEYDRNDEYLMHNEFMAYIMQQSFYNVDKYFLQIAGRASVNRIEGQLAAYIRATGAQAFVEAAAVLNDYAFDNWGLACGRVNLVSRR